MNPTLSGNSLPGQDVHGVATVSLIVPPSPPFIIPSTLPNATPGISYLQTLTAAGGQAPYTWSISGSSPNPIPSGLVINSASGVISGTPTGTAYGRQAVLVVITDGLGVVATLLFPVVVQWAGAALSITTTSLPSTTVASAYSQSIDATGGQAPYIWSIFGSLPPGLAITPSTGIISGTPTRFGIYSFTAQVADSTTVNVVSQQFTITVQPILAIDTISLPSASIGVAYSATMSASGGTPPYNWFVISGALPSGLSLDPQTGIISGTPTALSLSSITFEVIDSA